MANSTIIGRDNEVGRLSKIMISGTTPVVVVWGPPGVGKAALVEKVYSQFVLNRSATTSRRQFDLFGWVQVPNPFNLIDFSRSLLSVLRPHAPQSPDPIGRCSKLAHDHDCLVVLDGLRSAENLVELLDANLISADSHSCTVLVTTEKSLVTYMASVLPEDALFQVKPLDGPSAKKLFTQVYEREYRPNSSITDDDLLYVADKCCGLPIVILAVAEYLARLSWLLSNDRVTQFTAAVKDGKFIHELATKREPEFVGLKGLLAWVDSDLKACPESLKLLIMYMLHFSQEESVVVRRKRLVWRWIAEGYIKNTGICDMVTEAEQRVQELQDLTMMMVQVPVAGGSSRHRGYQLGFSGQVLLSRAPEDPLFLPLEVSALTEGNKQGSLTSSTGRHLRVDAKWERDEFVFRSLDLSRLRSLTVSGIWEPFFISDSMRVLRVLDLEGTEGIKNDDLKEIPKQLPRLRFLSLRECTDIDRLPDSIGDLGQLQTLDIKGTKITRLPDTILKLRNLQCLRAGHTVKEQTMVRRRRRRIISRLRGLASCPWQTTLSSNASPGVTMPIGMSQLTALHTLGIVNVHAAGGEQASLQELRHLKQLRKLELCGINPYNVRGLRHLRCSLDSLSLGFTEDCGDAASSSSIKVGLSGFASRQSFRLKLHGHAGSLEVLPDLTSGKQLVVHTLCLHVHTGTKLKFDANDNDGGFRQLKVLEITSGLDRDAAPLEVEFVRGEQDNSTLEVLKLVGSLNIPTGLNYLHSLKEVSIEEGLSQKMHDALKRHPKYPITVTVIDSSSAQ